MAQETTVLTARKRERTGSRYCRRIREQGGLPAIVYGHKQNPMAITLDAKETISHILKGEKVYTLNVEGGETETVLLRELQYDHLGTNIVHCDLTRVDLDERVHTNIPVHLIGEAEGLKKVGSLLVHRETTIEVECLVTNIPDALEVDISELDVGDAVLAGDVELPTKGMVLLSDPETVIARIAYERAAAPDTGEEAVVEEQAAPELVGEGREEEEEEGEE